MTANLPKQKHPFDESGKVFVNKEWYLALLALVNQSNSSGGGSSVADIALLEAVDASYGSEGLIEQSLADIVALVQALSPQDSTEDLITRLREIEIQLAHLPDYPDSSSQNIEFIDELGSGGTPGFASGVDFVPGTTTTLTLSQSYGAASNLFVTFDSAWQGADQFSLTNKTLTFTSAIPNGTSKVFVKGLLMT